MANESLTSEERVAQLEAALRPFVDACDYAAHMCGAARISAMDARDYFMWQTSRKLSVANFTFAKSIIEQKP